MGDIEYTTKGTRAFLDPETDAALKKFADDNGWSKQWALKELAIYALKKKGELKK